LEDIGPSMLKRSEGKRGGNIKLEEGKGEMTNRKRKISGLVKYWLERQS